MKDTQIVERLHKALNINERNYDLTVKEKFGNSLTEFSLYAKKVLP